MNMHRMKDDCVAALLLLVSLLGSGASEALYITQQSATKTVNDTFFVLCRDDGGRPVTWRGPKGILGPRTRPMVQITSYGTNIVFNGTMMTDSGTYTCSSGDEQKEFNLTMAAPLTFMDTSSSQTGIEGKDVTLRCEVRGGKVAWSVDGGDITDKNKFIVMGDGLLIKKVHRSDSRTYICKAVQQSTGTVVDRKIKLRVLHKPSFTHPRYAEQEVVYGYINGTVNLTCIVLADPPAKFEWLTTNPKNEKIGKIINESDEVSILQLHIDKSTFGDYKCIATNSYGRLEKRFSLEEGAKPYPPELIELKSADSNSLELLIHGPDKAKIEAGMEIQAFNVQFKKTDDAEWENREFNVTEDGAYVLNDLTHDSEYLVRAATKNVVGLSDYTDAATFKTLISQPDGVHLASGSLYCVAAAAITTILVQMYDMVFW